MGVQLNAPTSGEINAEPAIDARPQRARWPLILLALPAAIYLTLFYFYPMAAILQASFARAADGAGAAVAEVLGSAAYLKIIGFTIFQATLSTLITLAVGLPGAYLL